MQYNIKKTTQTVSILLKNNNGSMNYMKLIKLLYLIDRKALEKWGKPITGDTYFSMKHGPVLSNVLDHITHEVDKENPNYWIQYISEKNNYDIALLKEAPIDELSKREIDLINEFFETFIDFDEFQMVDYCHKNLPEWEDPGHTSIEIKIDKILKILDKTDEEIKYIKEELYFSNYLKTVLGN
jgi:uncharacterized phage-associated protein